MKVIKKARLTLAASKRLVRVIGEKDGAPYEFVSTKAVDDDEVAHSVTFEHAVWNSMCGCSVLDTVTIEGMLCIPEGERVDENGVTIAADKEYADACYEDKRTGRKIVFGNMYDAKPVAVVKSLFPAANFDRFELLPVYIPKDQRQKQAATMEV